MTARSTLILLIAIFTAATFATACGENAEDSGASAVQVERTTVSRQSSQPPAPATQAISSGPSPATPGTQPSPPSQSDDAPALSVVSTSNIVGDWIQRVGGERVNVFSLLPPDADPHTFQPGARDVAKVADADLVFGVGLSLEGGWLNELIENAAQDHETVVSLAELAEPIEFVDIFGEDNQHEDEETDEEDEDHEEEEGHDEDQDHEEEQGRDEGNKEEGDHEHGTLDPHFWFDPLRVQNAINDIAARLSILDSEGSGYYQSNAESYISEISELHTWIQAQVDTIPEDDRLLVTSHDSFRYFATRYGFKVVGAIFPTTTEADPTAQDLATLAKTIEREGAHVVFGENIHSDRLAMRIAEETGARVVGSLYTGSLGDTGGEAGTYIDMMRLNVETIVEALR